MGADDAGDKILEFDYFTGARRRYVPRIVAARGNPIVMIFLQSVVYELARLDWQGPSGAAFKSAFDWPWGKRIPLRRSNFVTKGEK